MRVFLIFLVSFLAGCSAAVKDINLIASSGENWAIEKGLAKYQCGNSEISAGGIGVSRLIVSGPIIPLIPFSHEYPGYLSLTVTQQVQCPTININSSELSAYKTNEYKSTVTCEYKLGDFSQVNEAVITIKAQSCTTSPLKFKSSTNWSYCLVCSA